MTTKTTRFVDEELSALITRIILALRAETVSYSAPQIAAMLNNSPEFIENGWHISAAAVTKRANDVGAPPAKQQGRPRNGTAPALRAITLEQFGYVRKSPEKVEAAERKMSLRAWIAENIATHHREGTLPVGIDALRTFLAEQLPEYLREHAKDLKPLFLFEIIDTIFWKKKAKILKDAFIAKYSAAELHRILVDQDREEAPPLWVIEAKYEELDGLISAPHETQTTLRGINRFDIDNAPSWKSHDSSFEEPLHLLPGHESTELDVAFIGSPMMGLPYHPIIEDNLVRRGIAAARKRGADALVIAGGLFHHDFTKTMGPASVLRSLVFADQLNFDILDEAYREEARNREHTLEPIYETAAERFASLLRAWWKVTRRPEYKIDPDTSENVELIGEKPEFEGPVYVLLAPEDLALVFVMSYYRLNYARIQDYAVAKARLRIAAAAYEKARIALLNARRSGFTLRPYKERLEAAKQQLEAATGLEVRTRNSNLKKMRVRQVFERALSYLVMKIEEAIPNAKVIGLNRAYVRFGQNKQVLCLVSGEKGNPFYKELGNYGKTQRDGKLPDATIVMHPGVVYPRGTVRANYLGAKMEGESAFMELPTLLDKQYIMDATHGLRSPFAAIRAASDSMYQSGMAMLKVRASFVPHADILTDRIIRPTIVPHKPATQKYVWLMHKTDWHFGGAMRYRLTDHHGLPIACTETALALMLRSGIENGMAHVAGFIANDDGVHGNHFGTHKQHHPNEMTNPEVLREIGEALNDLELLDNKDAIIARQLELLRFAAWQIDYRVPHDLTYQHLGLSQTMFGQYLDVFAGILRRSARSKVQVRGISHYTGMRYDSRDIGIINLPTGNHGSKSVDYMDLEGVHLATKLQLALTGMRGMRAFDLTKAVRAPLLQREAEGVGTIQIAGGAPWGMSLMATPPKRDSWKDLLHGWVMVNKSRGNITTALDRMPVLHFTGDKHFYAWCIAGGDAYQMGSADTHTDGFANMAGGLPPNIFGVDFFGFPVGGPEAGPVRSVHLSAKELQPYIGHRTKAFPWAEVLPNRL